MQLVIGAVIEGRYVVEAPLGAGAMGSVWRVRHPNVVAVTDAVTVQGRPALIME